MLYEAEKDAELKTILMQADYTLPDGAGIFVAQQITHSRLPSALKYLFFPYWCLRSIIHGNGLKRKYGERITGARLTRDMLQYAQQKKITVTIIDPIVS
jgi:UDP-N-acetyl-D-mannosaminuronic acid transferase (WecB/TagA/CpsF family)